MRRRFCPCGGKEGESGYKGETEVGIGRGLAYMGNFLPFLLDCIAKVLLDHSHRGNGVGAESLDYLQRSHEAVLVDFLQHQFKLATGFFKDLWT
jgi:hypothetical protein